jgi:predicted TIM-barrel fold metal-dependent hydrolase
MFDISTDWPQGSVDSPAWVVKHRGVDEDLQSSIYHENAEALFGRTLADT